MDRAGHPVLKAVVIALMNLIATLKDNVKAFDMKTPFLIFSATLFCFAFSKDSNACSSMASPLAWDAGFAHNFDWDTVPVSYTHLRAHET